MIRSGSRSVGVVMMTAIVVVLVIFLVITWFEGDTTDHLEERQPSPSPAESSAPALAPSGVVAQWPVAAARSL